MEWLARRRLIVKAPFVPCLLACLSVVDRFLLAGAGPGRLAGLLAG